MAKRQKTTRFSIQSYDAAHYRQTEQYTQAVNALFDRATTEIAKAVAKGTYDPDKPFSFDDYPGVKSVMQGITKQLADRMITVIETGSKKQWLFACEKNDGFIASIMDTSKLSKARLKKMQDRNLEALQTFQGRKVEGMNLSQRVWKYVGQYKAQLESALDVGLGEGRNAAQLSRDVRENLKEPNRLFRRVRDKRGNLVLSKAAKAFHPGQGVYRSSYKNAMRLTRSEINMAYRESDFLRWQSLDFVVGYEIRRSNHEPLFKCDICEKLVGRYPKTFKFKGWHPQCMCYAVPILMDEETFDENELGDLKAALHGTQYKKLEAKNLVTDVPDGFKQWVKDHKEAQKKWASTPYFIKDNFKDGQLSKGLKIALPTKPTIQVDVLAPYKAQIANARQLATKWGLSVQLNMLDKYVAEKDIPNIQSRIATIQTKAMQMEQVDAEIRHKCSEWGLSTYILDEAMRNPDSKNILAKMAELEERYMNAEKEYNSFISDANKAIHEARKYKIDVSEMLNDIAAITGDKREWIMVKASYKKALQDLLDKIQDAKGTPKAEPTKLDDVFANIEKAGVEYREVKMHEKQPTESDIIARVGGGDRTTGSCASLAFAWAANKGGMDVLDFRGGKSLNYFCKLSNLMQICDKLGGYSAWATGIQMMKQTEIGKQYYLAIGRHAAIVRQVSKGKYEYLELQSAYSNGWKPLDGKTFGWRFSARGKDYGLLIDIEVLQKDSGFRKMVGYINTAESEQNKGTSGTIK